MISSLYLFSNKEYDSLLVDFILGEDIEEDSENGVIPVDVTLSCTPTEEDVYGAY